MQTFQHGQQCLTTFAESVLHPGRHLAEDATPHHGIGLGLQFPQLGRQHLVAHPHQGSLQGREAAPTTTELTHDHQLPASAHHPQGEFRRADLVITAADEIVEKGCHGSKVTGW